MSTGVSGLAAGCATFLANPTGANFFSCISNESGTAGTVMRATGATATTFTVSDKLIVGQGGGGQPDVLSAEMVRVEVTPDAIETLNYNRVTCHGDNTTSIGCTGAVFIAQDDSTVTSSNKGILIALNLQVVPDEDRDNSPVDDVVGLHITNQGTAKGTDAIFVGNGPSVTGSQWCCLAVLGADADYGIRVLGDILEAHLTCGQDAGDDCVFRTTEGTGSGDQFIFQRGTNGATVQAIIDATGLTLATGSRVDIGSDTGDTGTTCTAFTGGICTTASSPEWTIFDLYDMLQALRAEMTDLKVQLARQSR
jgi:hypothetical protein